MSNISTKGGDNNYYGTLRTEVLSLVPAYARKILDVGCGDGTLGQAIKARQPSTVDGVEISEKAGAVAANRLDKVWINSIEEAIEFIPNDAYDCIVCADVLEHLQNPWIALKRLSEKITPDGTIIISVPNISHWSIIDGLNKGKWDYRTSGILDVTHLRFFTRDSMKELLWNADLKILESFDRTIKPKSSRTKTEDPNKKNSDSDVYQFLTKSQRITLRYQPSVLIIILNWNGGADTCDCLRSLANINYKNHRTLVIDNASTDNSIELIKRDFPDTEIIRNDQNFGYAGGNNVGITIGLNNSFDYILLLNNDTVVDANFLEPLVKAMEAAPNISASQPKIFYHGEPNILWCTGASFDRDALDFTLDNNKTIDCGDSFERITEIEICVGAAILLRSSVIREVGVLDRDFYLMHEESDWCFRARKKGYSCIVVPKSKIWHKVSASLGEASPLMTYFSTRNLLCWVKRHVGYISWACLFYRTIRAAFLLPSAKYIIFGSSKEGSRHIKNMYWRLSTSIRKMLASSSDPMSIARRQAIYDYCRNRFGNCPDHVRELNKSRRPTVTPLL